MDDVWDPATTPNFAPETDPKLCCTCGKCDGAAKMSQSFMLKLQRLRDAFGPLTVTSGYRCPQHPETMARPNSYHAKGRAADLAVVGGPRKRLLVLADKAGLNGWGFGSTFTHLDDRPVDATWTY